MRTTTFLAAVAILQVLLSGSFAGRVHAQPDGDWPYAAEGGYQATENGNPLSDGDDVYNLRFSYRFFRGDLGLATAFAYAEPQDGAAEFRQLDVAVVWYTDYKRQSERFSKKMESSATGLARIKSELVVFGGPGWARLKTDGANSETEDFFTVSGGIGVNFYRLKGEDRETSHLFLRPEIWARWFAGDGGGLDSGWGVTIGYGFGKRLSRDALELRVHQVCDGVDVYELAEAREYRRMLDDLRAQVIRCGAEKCASLQEMTNGCISQLDRALFRLEAAEADG